MKKFFKIFVSILCAAVIALPVFAACDPKDDDPNNNDPEVNKIDYVSQLTLDMTTNTKKQEVTVRNFVDGDTTHFDPVANSEYTDNHSADFASTQGYIKARYLAIDTPESTGKIEKWGKTASKFTRSKLEPAGTKIIVESDTGTWNPDSTGSRYMLWVWYKPAGESEFRNLNVEILQEGLAIASNTANNRYGEIASAALEQAKQLKLYVHSPESTVDPNFYTGQAIPVSMKYLRCHLKELVGLTVRVEGYVVAQVGVSAYIQNIEEEDEATQTYYGIYVYFGYTQPASIYELMACGNKVSVVASVEYYETGDSYQLSGVEYIDGFRDPEKGNSKLISSGHEVVFTERTADEILNSAPLNVEFDGEDEPVEIDFGDAIMSTGVKVSDLRVVDVYTTHNGGNNDGAISITCEAPDGTTITVRTEVLLYENGNMVTQDVFVGQTITVKGVIDDYEGVYQVKVYDFYMIEFL